MNESNHTTRRTMFLITLLAALTLLLGACRGGTPTVEPTAGLPEAALTAAAATISAQLTQNAPAIQPTDLPYPAPTEPVATVIHALPNTSTPMPTETPIVILPTETPIPTPMPVITPTAVVTVPVVDIVTPPLFPLVYESDFAHKVGWFTEDDTGRYGFLYKDQYYRIFMNFPNGAVVSVRDPIFADNTLEAKVLPQTASAGTYYGLACRMQNLQNFYGLTIGPGGGYGIFVMEASKITWLMEGTDTAGLIQKGENQLRADCIGTRLTLYVNGQVLASVEDQTFITGASGFTVGARGIIPADVLFSEYKVYAP